MKEIFDSQFKFKINDPVRHRGDTKDYTADMGLLIIERHLIESEDHDGNQIYERSYVCRMIRFSGSGDLARFQERELISIAEYEVEKAKLDRERHEMHQEAKMTEKEVLEVFGISKEDYLYEVTNGTPDTSKKFRMSGFKINDTGITLLVRESLFTASNRTKEGDKVAREDREWKAKSQFIKVG